MKNSFTSLYIDNLKRYLYFNSIDEDIVIVDESYMVIYAKHRVVLNDVANDISLFELPCFLEVAGQLKDNINKISLNSSINKNIMFLGGDKIKPYLVEIAGILNPDAEKLELFKITVNEYKPNNILLTKLKKSCFKKTNLQSIMLKPKKINYEEVIRKLTDFQLAICYLMAHNYTNEDIANIINSVDSNRKTPTSRWSINKQVEKIRELFMMPSKEALIDLIIALNIHHEIPQLIYGNIIDLQQ